MRKAIDTNVLVRLLARDNSDQWRRASDLLAADTIVISTTVLLETEWVLRSALGYSDRGINSLFCGLLSLENVEFVEEQRVMSAVSLHVKGLDFADALHLLASEGCDQFVTFDKAFNKLARKFAAQLPTSLL